MTYTKEELTLLQQKHPLLNKIINLNPVTWLNPNLIKNDQLNAGNLTIDSIYEAEQLWQRFAPFFIKEFPETKVTNGIIESPLHKISAMKKQYKKLHGTDITGQFYLKSDNDLPIAGSIKARGGFYEILHYAESLAIDAELITKEDNYELFSSDKLQAFFKQYSIGVGSTGNLGLSIGIMSAKLGFKVSVYMSADAKQWKKDLLKAKGVHVHEFDGDFSEAIATGRKETNSNPKGYFVDDEDSEHLFVGYSTAALRLKNQLKEENVTVDEKHPLFIYLPCGVGGAPGGITFGAKHVFGDHVHCFFVEPTHSPSVLIGLLTGEKEKVSVQDFGIDNRTEADGLAVGRPSKFASTISEQLVSGIYTMEDDELFTSLASLIDHEGIHLEPSATAGIIGPREILNSDYIKQQHIKPENITHIAWATGGALVPDGDMKDFYARGKDLLKK